MLDGIIFFLLFHSVKQYLIYIQTLHVRTSDSRIIRLLFQVTP